MVDDRLAPSLTPPAARRIIPARLTPLIGRERELTELSTVLGGERVVTLTGAGGVGKSRLAMELASRDSHRFPGGVAWVELASCTDLASVVSYLATMTDVIELTGESLLDRVVDSLRARPAMLIVLDNTEHVVSAAAQVIADLTAGAGRVTVVSTSREPVGAPGEVIWRVPSLTVPPLDDPSLATAATVGAFDAVRLFAERARRARRGFRLTDANAAAVAHICARLDGLPLAIELAAARVRSLPPERIASQLDDRFRLLAGGPRTLVARQQTLHASVQWSEGLLTEIERIVFRRLGVFVAGFTIDATESVIATFGDIDPYEVAEVVSRLVDKSLVHWDDEHDRHSLLETIRSYALERLMEAGETAQARDAHAEWIAAWLETVSDEDDSALDVNSWWDSRVAAVDAIVPEWPNCAAALEWTDPSSELALRLVAGLGDFWAIRQATSDSARYGMPAVTRGDRNLPMWLTAVLRLQSVRTNALDSDFAMIREEAAQLAAERGDRRATIRLDIARVIMMAMLFGPKPELLAELDAVRAEALEMREWYTAWNAMQSPAVMLAGVGRLADAEVLVQSLRSSRALLIKSTVALLRGDLVQSEHLERAAASHVDSRAGATLDRMLVSFRAALAALSLCNGEVLDSSSAVSARIDSLPQYFSFADAMARGVRDLVEGQVAAARATFAGVRMDLFASWQCVAYLAQIEMSLGEVDAARHSAMSLADACRELRAPLYETASALVLAECRRDDVSAALDEAHRALTVASEAALWPAAVDAMEAIAAFLVDAGRTRDAARLLAACEAARSAMQYHYRFPHRAAYVADTRRAVEADAGWVEGTALSLVEAVSVAQRMRGQRLRPVAGWASLTPTERQVASLVASGLTNPQIAEQLLMSRATVKTHLVHTYTKLGISNRAELAAGVARWSAQ